MQYILIADDNQDITDILGTYALKEGFEPVIAKDGEEALNLFDTYGPSVVLLDVMMPRLNGFMACEQMRKLDALVPVIFLTAKDSQVDQVRGLGLGADDYVSKSAGEEVLIARLRRAIARAKQMTEQVSGSKMLRLGTVEVDLERRTVSVDGEKEMLTASETDLLRCLSSAPGKPFSSDEILSFLRGEGYIGDPATVRMHIMNLRRKLGKAGSLIANIPNAGYYLIG